jgi:hypothetical protein
VRRTRSRDKVIEDKVQLAADELELVTGFLEEEVAERQGLERALAQRPDA